MWRKEVAGEDKLAGRAQGGNGRRLPRLARGQQPYCPLPKLLSPALTRSQGAPRTQDEQNRPVATQPGLPVEADGSGAGREAPGGRLATDAAGPSPPQPPAPAGRACIPPSDRGSPEGSDPPQLPPPGLSPRARCSVLTHASRSVSHHSDHLSGSGFVFFSSVPCLFKSFPGVSAGKDSPCNVGGLGSIPGLGRCPGDRKGSPRRYSGLENPPDCRVHAVARRRTRLSDFHFTQCLFKLFHSDSLGTGRARGKSSRRLPQGRERARPPAPLTGRGRECVQQAPRGRGKGQRPGLPGTLLISEWPCVPVVSRQLALWARGGEDDSAKEANGSWCDAGSEVRLWPRSTLRALRVSGRWIPLQPPGLRDQLHPT